MKRGTPNNWEEQRKVLDKQLGHTVRFWGCRSGSIGLYLCFEESEPRKFSPHLSHTFFSTKHLRYSKYWSGAKYLAKQLALVSVLRMFITSRSYYLYSRRRQPALKNYGKFVQVYDSVRAIVASECVQRFFIWNCLIIIRSLRCDFRNESLQSYSQQND